MLLWLWKRRVRTYARDVLQLWELTIERHPEANFRQRIDYVYGILFGGYLTEERRTEILKNLYSNNRDPSLTNVVYNALSLQLTRTRKTMLTRDESSSALAVTIDLVKDYQTGRLKLFRKPHKWPSI